MFYRKLSSTLLTLFLIFTLISCSENGIGPDNSIEPDGSGANINGSVENSTTGQLTESSSFAKSVSISNEGIAVAAAEATSSGSIRIIEGTETETDANGEFSLNVDTDLAEHIVIVAQTASGELKGFLSTSIENGQSYTLKPINTESSAETEVYTELVANGDADVVQKSDIDAVIASEAATRINASSTAAVEIAAGLTSYAEAEAEYLAELGVSEAEAAIEATSEAKANAQFQFESQVDASSSAEEEQNARDAYLEAIVNSYIEAGIEEESVAKLTHMQGYLLAESFSSSSSEIKADVKASTSVMAAIALDAASQASAEASGMSDATQSAIADAGISLKSEIKASGSTISAIEASFETYHDEVRNAIENDSSTEASVVIEIDTQINATGGAKSDFETALSGLLNISSTADAYINFESSVETIVSTRSELLGDIDAEAVTKLFVLINLNS